MDKIFVVTLHRDMAGLYIHIPFCASRCVYCGFFSTTRLDQRQAYVEALGREMRLETVYLGGGTPSQLSAEQLRQIFLYINNVYDVSPRAEITIECNPDDITVPFVAALSQLPVNRVSMGAQTFNDERLRFLHRRHRAEQVGEAVKRLRSVGIANISIDLMYGFPGETMLEWNADIDAALALGVEHLSAYALSYEHYELSNFARPGCRSRHNSSYWNHTPYIGLGAGAHSFDGRHRQWNVADIGQYVEAIGENRVPADSEVIDDVTRYNETVMTALRTIDGIRLDMLSTSERAHCLTQAKKFLDCGWLCLPDDNTLRLTRDGLFVSDTIMSENSFIDHNK